MSYFPLPQIIEQIADDSVIDDSVISQADVDKYLNDSLIPYVTQQYGKSFKVNATLEQFIRDLVNAVENGKLRSEVNLPFPHDNLQQLQTRVTQSKMMICVNCYLMFQSQLRSNLVTYMHAYIYRYM